MIDDDNFDPADPPDPWGLQVGAGDLLRDVVRLMAYIDAGPNIASIWRGPERDPDEQLATFRRIAESYLRTEIPRLLISIAATLRTKVDDGSWQVDENEYIGWVSQSERVDVERGEALNVREACNKIIHAKRVHPKETMNKNGSRSITTLVTLAGDRNAKPWAAELNLQAFCITVANSDFNPNYKGCRS